MFVFPVKEMLEELARFEPAMVAGAAVAVDRASHDAEVMTLDAAAFGAVPSKSIDYALMERTERSAIVPADLGWSDVGSWSALWEIADRDPSDNVLIGDAMVEETTGSYLRSTGPLIAALGVEDLIVVATGDVVMVAAKDRSQDVKRFVTRLKEAGRSEGVAHRLVHRAWGSDQTIDSGADHQVRRITVKPGATLPPRSHARHGCHWIVLGGTARVTSGDRVQTLTADMSVHIAPGAIHGLENIGADRLELIEVQSGGASG
jgi:mannose-1-phosphate guanylyltransferase/mannose-6-phosphate isomerase